MIGVPTIPPALSYMVNPPGGRIRGVTLLKKLNECSPRYDFCRACTWVKYCEFYHDFLIEIDAVKNWKGGNRNVSRFTR